ncbi:ATP-binding protein [Pseudomonas lundensis]|uniref:ATP-binding protein n=1 Tax=Pseudomonas lundensis TaxID=86185 RepID=UPI00089DAB9A|nr:ATP-binding protein [Pseudomonas lundensis]
MNAKYDPTTVELKSLTPMANDLPRIDWDAPNFAELVRLPKVPDSQISYRMLHISEIGEGKPDAYRQAMTNVISCLNSTSCASVYILSGRPEGIDLYLGVATSSKDIDIPDASKMLRATFEGNFLGARLEDVRDDDEQFQHLYRDSRHLGMITGVPSFNDSERAAEEDFQGVERLANSLVGETWQLTIYAEPGTDDDVRATLDSVYNLSTLLSAHIKQSVQQSENSGWQSTQTTGTSTNDTKGTSKATDRGLSKTASAAGSNGKSTQDGKSKSTNTGTNESESKGTSDSLANGTSGGQSLAMTRERTDKRAEELQKHLSETLIERFLQGRSKGMYRTAIYVSAETRSTFERLSRGLISTFQGNNSSVTPLRVHKLQSGTSFNLSELLQLRRLKNKGISADNCVAHSAPLLPGGELLGATWLNIEELALVAGLPSLELPGLKIRKNVDFALNTGTDASGTDQTLKIGKIIQHGRLLKYKPVSLPLKELSKHVFVTGVTGAGKTTTCMNLLLESKLPFMVIEPAKTEYRALHGRGVEVDYYTLGREDLTPFRLNPFELVSSRQNLASHISVLNATLAAVFPMEAAMPSIVEEAIIEAYKAKGWDIHSTQNFLLDDPWKNGSDAWPTFSDMIAKLDKVITSKQMGREFEEKYRGSLVALLTSLTLGVKGRMLNSRYSMNFDQLLDRHVVIEMEEIKDEKDKALLMGLIINRLAECMKQRHRIQPAFQHLTLIEEAHRLLSRPEPGDAESKKMGVEMFANLLAEVRKYGEGLIIADQIPNKLIADVIKNTNTKIVHRLFAADDRKIIGDAIGLSEEQQAFLPLLKPGETIVYCGGWHGAVRVQIEQIAETDAAEIPEETIKQRGRLQLWEQRQKLLPRLAADPLMSNPDHLAQTLEKGCLLINMFLTLNHLRVQVDSSKPLHARIAQRFGVESRALCDALVQTPKQVFGLLTKVFEDCASIPGWYEEDWALIRPLLDQAFNALGDSLEAFETACAQRPMKGLELLKSFDSI